LAGELPLSPGQLLEALPLPAEQRLLARERALALERGRELLVLARERAQLQPLLVRARGLLAREQAGEGVELPAREAPVPVQAQVPEERPQLTQAFQSPDHPLLRQALF